MNINNLTIGIDASNIRAGGGLTHLVELLRVANPSINCFNRIVVWGGSSTLKELDDHLWLTKCNPTELNKGFFHCTLWQRFHLSHAARNKKCDVLFILGGIYAGNFKPVVCMSQNLLPFEMRELSRFGWSLVALRLLLLRVVQARSFQNSDGVVFLTKYAMETVLKVTGKIYAQKCIISHGYNLRFDRAPKPQLAIEHYDDKRPFRILYVSSIEPYKHQWNVVEALYKLRKLGLPITLDLVGDASAPSKKRLTKSLNLFDASREWVNCHGKIPYGQLHFMYEQADIGIWASSCETFGIGLLEAMASGLPMACSVKLPMPEILGDSGVYFDPEQPLDIYRALRKLIDSPNLRMEMARRSYNRSHEYSWRGCADETFSFLLSVVCKNRDSLCAAS